MPARTPVDRKPISIRLSRPALEDAAILQERWGMHRTEVIERCLALVRAQVAPPNRQAPARPEAWSHWRKTPSGPLGM